MNKLFAGIRIPDVKTLLKTTGLVMAAMAVIAVCIFGVDTAFTEIYVLIRSLLVL